MLDLSSNFLDGHGVLAEGARLPSPAAGYLVFGQASPPPFDLDVLRAYATRFFSSQIGLSAEKTGTRPEHDLAFVLVHREGEKGTVPVEARAATDDDRALAVRAEGAEPAGLGLLAARCPRVFVVHADSAHDRPALLVASILAGTSLGPIVSLDGKEIFGVKSARARLEARG